MRIRKYANLSSLVFSHAQPLQTHVCQLNQSPWDVIPFSPPPLIHLQMEGEDSFNGNGSLGDPIAGVESSLNSIMEGGEEEKKVEVKAMDDNGEEKVQCCKKKDGKGWHCKNETKRGETMCGHHMASMKSASSSTKKPEKNQGSGSGRRGQAKTAKKGATSAANPYEFYYYSGFGPRWGKRRGGGGGMIDKSVEIDGEKSKTTSYCVPSSADQFGEIDFLDDEEDSDENGESGKKRIRKPVKARSLKSLM